MKRKRLNLFVTCLLFVVAGIALQGCDNKVKVKEQTFDMGEGCSPVGGVCIITISNPLTGPQVMRDSIAAFLNEQLYDLFDQYVDKKFSREEVFHADIATMMKHYVDTYAPYFSKEFQCNLELRCHLISQSDTEVTYEIDRKEDAGEVNRKVTYYSFSKKDGHKVHETKMED